MRIALFWALVAGLAIAQSPGPPARARCAQCAAWDDAARDGVGSKPGAIVAQGNVRVDGKQVQRTGNIFPGEKLESGSDGSANITSDGAVASVKGSARLTYGENAVDLDCGQLRVATIHQFEVRSHGVNVTPAGATKTQMVAEQGDAWLTISAVEGSLNVVKDRVTTVVKPGESKKFNDGAHCVNPVAGWVPGYLWVASWVPFIPDSDTDHDRDDISTSKPD